MLETLKNLTALVVDDEAEIRDAYREALEDFFLKVYVASDGSHALQICEEKKIHAAFVDYEMPNLDGFGFIKAVRKFDEEIAVTLISNHSNPKILQKFFPFKPCGYLFKPLRYRDFKEHLKLVAKELGGSDTYCHLSGRHRINFLRMQLICEQRTYTPTRLESDFLQVLYERRGRVVSYGAILEAIDQESFSLNGIKDLVYRIKRKYQLDTIQNIKGLGYKMEVPRS